MVRWVSRVLSNFKRSKKLAQPESILSRSLAPTGPCYIARLPFELLLPILDLGAEGYSTRHRQRNLAGLSLICRAWREVAQTLLWRRPTFVSSKAARRFLEVEPEGGFTTRSLTTYAPRSGEVRGRVTEDLVEMLVERCRPWEFDLDELAGPVLASPALADLKVLRFEETPYSHPYRNSVPFSLERLSINAYSYHPGTAFLTEARRHLFILLASSSFDTLTHLDLQDVDESAAFAFCIPFASAAHLTHLILPTYPTARSILFLLEPWDPLIGTFLSKATRLTHLSIGDVTTTTFAHIRSALPSTLMVLTVRQYVGLQLQMLVEALRDGNVGLEELRLPRGSLAGGKQRGFIGMGDEYWCECY